MSMYKEYIKEMYGRECIETKHGFVVFEPFSDKSLYIHSIYIKPEFRGKKEAKELEKQLIQTYNPVSISCYTDLTTINPTQSIRCILSAGYKIVSASSEKMVFNKKIRHNGGYNELIQDVQRGNE